MRPSPPSSPEIDPPADGLLTATADGSRAAEPGPLCPVDRLPRRRRNQICIAIIVVGLVNFLAYTLFYAALGGDAHNGHRELVQGADGRHTAVYYVRGHFIHSLSGRERTVSGRAWIYSYLHSISVPLTSGALIISMLVLARPHIIATMRGGWISGPTFVTAFSTIIILITLGAAALFTWSFVEELSAG